MNTEIRHFIPLRLASDPGAYGRKAFNLALLACSGFRVPRGFVIPAGTPAGSLDGNLSADFAALDAPAAAVRSSAAAEDGAAKSFAGQFDTFLGVRADGLEQAVRACLASAAGTRAAAYGGGAPCRMSVIVQEMVDAEISGVAFSCDPVSGDRGTVLIEAVYGLCEPLVNGTFTPDHYAVTREGCKAKELSVARQEEALAVSPAGGTALRPVPGELRCRQKLGPEEIKLVAAAAVRAEALLDKPADIEWALKGGKLYLLQARPVTGLGDLK
jgi:pyruvate,water dikinase